ncbi:hypothetical protein LCFBJUUZ_CDS0154 [Staphylococcus phage PG-2021_76]|uniref:Uncharacterized protein n=1 Tax=Mammaliicoccus phage MSShimriz1 TaxID=3230127 RepID=A0AAU8GT34_9VIRU
MESVLKSIEGIEKVDTPTELSRTLLLSMFNTETNDESEVELEKSYVMIGKLNFIKGMLTNEVLKESNYVDKVVKIDLPDYVKYDVINLAVNKLDEMIHQLKIKRGL